MKGFVFILLLTVTGFSHAGILGLTDIFTEADAEIKGFGMGVLFILVLVSFQGIFVGLVTRFGRGFRKGKRRW